MIRSTLALLVTTCFATASLAQSAPAAGQAPVTPPPGKVRTITEIGYDGRGRDVKLPLSGRPPAKTSDSNQQGKGRSMVGANGAVADLFGADGAKVPATGIVAPVVLPTRAITGEVPPVNNGIVMGMSPSPGTMPAPTVAPMVAPVAAPPAPPAAPAIRSDSSLRNDSLRSDSNMGRSNRDNAPKAANVPQPQFAPAGIVAPVGGTVTMPNTIPGTR